MTPRTARLHPAVPHVGRVFGRGVDLSADSRLARTVVAYKQAGAFPKQGDVALSAGVPRNEVKALMQEAADRGMYEQHIDLGTDERLREELRASFGMRDVVVARIITNKAWEDGQLVRQVLGPLAVRYISGYLEALAPLRQKEDVVQIAIDGGHTLFDAISASAKLRVPDGNHEVTPLVLGPLTSGATAARHAAVIANLLAEKLDPRHGTVEVKTRHVIDHRRGRSDAPAPVHIDFASWKRLLPSVHLFVVGIGGPHVGTLRDRLKEQRQVGNDVAGDMCSNAFDRHGEPLPDINFDSLPLVSLADLRRLANTKAHVVGVAGGKDKLEAIQVALDRRWINALITDDLTAQELLAGRQQKRGSEEGTLSSEGERV